MALGKKVKTLLLRFDDAVAVAGAAWDLRDSHTFQDDVRVIGGQVGNRLEIPDAMMNADHQVNVGCELSRHGAEESAGVIARNFIGASWTAAIVAALGVNQNSTPFSFPDGHGIDFDDGETIYLHGYSLNVGTVAATNLMWAIVYYVER